MSIELVTGRVLFLGVMALLALLISRLFRLDLTLGALISGILSGLFVTLSGFDTGIRAFNFKPLVFYIVLPLLIFQAAWHIQPKILARVIVPAMILAVPGVLISGFVTAGLIFIGVNHSAFPWVATLLTGVILAATDPVSVIAKLKNLHAPQELETLIEAESLLNDASAVVLFGVVLAYALGEISGLSGEVAIEFSVVFFGGLLLGVLLGFTATGLAKWLDSSPATSIITLLAALGSFYVAEHILHLSGILSVVATSLVMRRFLNNTSYLESATDTWEWIGLLFNALLFSLMGLVITYDMFVHQWLAMLIAIAAMLVARVAAVMVSGLLSRGFGHPLSLVWQGMLVWGGLRGAIAIALVLSLPVELPYWWTIQSMVFGVVLFSIVVQGMTVGRLASKIKLSG